MVKLSTPDFEARREFIKWLKRHEPRHIKDMRGCTYNLRFMKNGAFRSAYTIDSLDMVIKFPNETIYNSGKENIRHSLQEVEAWKKITSHKRYYVLRRYLPNLYYSNKYGVVVMEKYKTREELEECDRTRLCAMCRILDNLYEDLIPRSDKRRIGSDVHGSNVGFDEFGECKLLDLGLGI
jgi:hypothetical protein